MVIHRQSRFFAAFKSMEQILTTITRHYRLGASQNRDHYSVRFIYYNLLTSFALILLGHCSMSTRHSISPFLSSPFFIGKKKIRPYIRKAIKCVAVGAELSCSQVHIFCVIVEVRQATYSSYCSAKISHPNRLNKWIYGAADECDRCTPNPHSKNMYFSAVAFCKKVQYSQKDNDRHCPGRFRASLRK